MSILDFLFGSDAKRSKPTDTYDPFEGPLLWLVGSAVLDNLGGKNAKFSDLEKHALGHTQISVVGYHTGLNFRATLYGKGPTGELKVPVRNTGTALATIITKDEGDEIIRIHCDEAGVHLNSYSLTAGSVVHFSDFVVRLTYRIPEFADLCSNEP